jgi:hypothetical protein
LTIVYVEPNVKGVSKKRGTKNANNRNIWRNTSKKIRFTWTKSRITN